jgi:hypothetical protein
MGHPFCFGCPKEDKDNNRSLRDDNKKGNGKSNRNGKGNRRSFDFAQDDKGSEMGIGMEQQRTTDDRFRRWGIGMEQQRKTADFSAALLTMKL